MSATGDNKRVVLAFSGGLDTSFCIPYLQERGWEVHTVFADTGGVDAEERAYIEQRAAALGATTHQTVDIAQPIWDSFVVPLIQAGQWYQGQYPLLVSDRYLIVEHSLKRCDELGTKAMLLLNAAPTPAGPAVTTPARPLPAGPTAPRPATA